MRFIALFLVLALSTLSMSGCCSLACWIAPAKKDGVKTPDMKVKKPTSSQQDPDAGEKAGQ